MSASDAALPEAIEAAERARVFRRRWPLVVRSAVAKVNLSGGVKHGYTEAAICVKSHRPGVSFVHVFKSGGSSVHAMLADRCRAGNGTLHCFADHYECGHAHKSTPRRYLFGQPYYRSEKPMRLRAGGGMWGEPSVVVRSRKRKGALLFSVVRDPIDRAVSAYLELRRRGASGKPHPLGFEGSFDEFIRSIQRGGFWNGHLKPQADFLVGEDGAAPLPLDYLFVMPQLDAAQAWLQATLMQLHNDARGGLENRTRPLAERLLPPYHLRSPHERQHSALNLSFARPRPTAAQQRAICNLFADDYYALSQPLPPACRSG